MKISVCLGTRPEIIKLAPVIQELRKRGVEVSVCATGQHSNMADQAFKAFGLCPDINLGIGQKYKINGLNSTMSAILNEMDSYFLDYKPDMVLVQGDTNTVISAALAAYNQKIKIGHIEAGLRTGNLFSPWPEEGYRSMVSNISDLNFAPTEESKANLLREGIADSKIHVVGNTVIDSLKYMCDQLRIDSKNLNLPDIILKSPEKKIILVTGHRRENFDTGLKKIFSAIKQIADERDDVLVVLPAHFNPAVRDVIADVFKENTSNVCIIDAVPYREFVWLMQNSYFIVTDSGGIQEEAPSLGKPVLLTRDTTERPEALETGGIKMVGTDSDVIVEYSKRLLDDKEWYAQKSVVSHVYGDGYAARRIVDILLL